MPTNDFAYRYELLFEFSSPVRHHHLQVRGAPCLSTLIRPRRLTISSGTTAPLRVRRDPWNNLVYSGENTAAHGAWALQFAGEGRWTGEPDPRRPGDSWLGSPGPLTGWGPALEALWQRWPERRLPGTASRRRGLTDLLAQTLVYRSGVTDPGTTADQAAAGGAGVCQDWAHVFLALWRRSGGEARYAAGLADGEGQTHAWVELATAEGWEPWDPLRRCAALRGYLPLARGRDASDCRLNRGVFHGESAQTLTVRASLGQPLGVGR